jgi:hypothetical protein
MSNLSYQSQLESRLKRQIDKSYKARKKLGGEAGVEQIIPDKPKGLHWKSYFDAVLHPDPAGCQYLARRVLYTFCWDH